MLFASTEVNGILVDDDGDASGDSCPAITPRENRIWFNPRPCEQDLKNGSLIHKNLAVDEFEVMLNTFLDAKLHI